MSFNCIDGNEMMNRKEKLFAFISDENYIPLKFDEIAVLLDVPKSDYTELAQLLDELVDEGKIFKTKKNKYIATDNSPQLVVGTLSCNASRGFGFVRCEKEDESDIFIPLNAMNGAFDRDKVLVHIDKNENEHSRREGHIVNVIKRGNVQIVGVVRGIKSGKYVIAPDRREFFSDVLVPVPMAMEAKKGDRVLVKIDRYGDKCQAYGVVLTILGQSDSLFSCLNGVILENNYSVDFSDNVKSELKSIPDEVCDEDIKGREDLRDIITFTIDGDNSRDFDDAVSLEDLENGNMLLGVHIADVTHYVKEYSALDTEALNRATSVYFPHMVIPMLPKKMSNGICSLNPDVDRLTLSVFMEYDSNANLHSQRITKSVIHSHARMTYADVNKILDGDNELINEYKDISPILYKMNELSKKLIKKRDERGAIDFDFPETKIICDDDGNPIYVQKDVRGDSERLIESFMLSANETVAETAFWSELPFIYRVHEAPDTEKLTDFNNFIKNFGYSLKGKLDSNTIHPKALQEIAKAVKDTPEEMMISKIMLRSLMKACYRDTNDGHFGLASRYYCHFTSPIRRYPDLQIHRIIKDVLRGRMNGTREEHYRSILPEVARQSSERERKADEAERETIKLKKVEYMSHHLWEEFDGVISGVTAWGIYVELPNTVEGLVRTASLQGDYFEYNESACAMVGVHTGKSYAIGQKVKVQVTGADKMTRTIDFELVEGIRSTEEYGEG